MNAEVAHIFNTASEDQRRKLEALVSLKLDNAIRDRKSLEEVMSEISQNAQARGLTPEILTEILSDD